MVSLWPWKGEDNSPASFEKALSALATKISKSQTQLDALRSNGRRYKALWTLYTSFAYLLVTVVLVLVVGWKNWSIWEGAGLASGPVVIYLGRTALTAYYTYRTDIVAHRLEDQQAERTKTIEKLKTATKYNSTQELLEKYGGATPKPKKTPAPKTSKPAQNPPERTSIVPPPTANIPGRNQIPSQPSTPIPGPSNPGPSRALPQHMISAPSTPQPGPPEFAPNAFSAPQYAQGSEMGSDGHWYDRVLDLLLGEDETIPKNRIALICPNCRLVNGQAPPGTKSLADLGKWRCYGCGSLNGEEDEAVKVVQQMKEQIEAQADDSGLAEHDQGNEETVPEIDIKTESGSGEEVEADSAEEMIEVKPKKSRPKSGKKKA